MHFHSRYSLPLTFATCLAAPVVAETSLDLQTPQQATTHEQLYDSSLVHEIRIDIPAASWRKLRFQSRDLTKALGKELAPKPYSYFKGNITIDGHRVEGVKIRKKGFLGSLDDMRPSLKIRFDKGQSPFSGVDRITLNNNKQDESLLSQHLSYRVFQKAGLPAPRTSFARVIVNDTDLGIYTNVESVRRPFLSRQFKDGSGKLYEGTIADFFGDCLGRFETKLGTKSRAPLEKVARILARVDAKTADSLPLAELEEVIDLDTFLRFWAVESLLSFWDGYTSNQNNYFIYENPKDKRLHWIPWGADSIFFPAPAMVDLPRGAESVNANSLLAHLLYADSRVRARYLETLKDVMKTAWNEEQMLAEIDRVQELLEPHVHVEQKRFGRKIRKVQRFIEKRRGKIENELGEWPAIVPEDYRVPKFMVPFGKATVSFKTKWFDSSPAPGTQAGTAEVSLTLDGKKVVFEPLSAHAEPRRPAFGEVVRKGRVMEPSVTITGKGASGEILLLVVVVDHDNFHAADGKSVPAFGVYIDLARIMSGGLHFASGTVKFTAAERKAGAAIIGSFEIEVFRMGPG